MKAGTKTLLFGVHQVFVHPVFVFLAWCKLYGFPSMPELVAIVVHDWGLWGCEDVDGEQGRGHPARSYRFCMKVANACKKIKWRWGYRLWRDAGKECSAHSRHWSKKNNMEVSDLCYADKLGSALYPSFLWAALARMSGEWRDYTLEDEVMGATHEEVCKMGLIKFHRSYTVWAMTYVGFNEGRKKMMKKAELQASIDMANSMRKKKEKDHARR